MSLSEIIAKLEHDESIKFTREPTAVRFVVKKGDEWEEHKEVAILVDPKFIEYGKIDVLSFEVERALRAIRK
jgi:hypothetical protein